MRGALYSFGIVSMMRTDTPGTVWASWNRYSFMISSCTPATYLALYLSSLSSSNFMARTYLVGTPGSSVSRNCFMGLSVDDFT